MQELHIGENDAGQRFDKYLKKLLAEAPGSFVYKMLRKKNITLNGKKADGTEKLSCGDEVKLFLSDETYEKFRAKSKTVMPEAFSGSEKTLRQLKVLYEDADILIINKPSGMLSQKARPEDVSANEYILSYLLREGALTEEEMRTFRPSVCNRLDRNTSGILIAGKTLKGLQEMSKALKERTIQKLSPHCVANPVLLCSTHVVKVLKDRLHFPSESSVKIYCVAWFGHFLSGRMSFLNCSVKYPGCTSSGAKSKNTTIISFPLFDFVSITCLMTSL